MFTLMSSSDAGVDAYSGLCSCCGHENVFLLGASYKGIMGAKCGDCDTPVWFEARKQPILNQTPPFSHGEQYKAWRENMLLDFFKSLGSCPSCKNGHFNMLIQKHFDYLAHCKGCSREFGEQCSVDSLKPYYFTEKVWLYS